MNTKALAINKQRSIALRILQKGLHSVLTEPALKNNITRKGDILTIKGKKINLSRYENTYVIGAGKASAGIAAILEKKIGRYITSGAVIDTSVKKLKKIKVLRGTHPYPSVQNKKHTQKIIDIAEKATKNDLVICLISGGGSALLFNPTIAVSKMQSLTKKLLQSGASIQEINVIRKHASNIKGGRLAAIAHPAPVVSLIVSDVVGDDLKTIASGPTVRDSTTVAHAKKILKKYKIPLIKLTETPKERKYFSKVSNLIVVSGRDAIHAMGKEAAKLRLKRFVYSNQLTGEARNVGKKIASTAKRLPKGSVLLATGETTVTVKGKGKGGRNQELVLGALERLSKLDNVALASIGSDGIDFIPVAGAIADETTLAKAAKKKLSPEKYLKNNDSYHFFKKVGKSIIITGKTGTNVADLTVLVKL